MVYVFIGESVHFYLPDSRANDQLLFLIASHSVKTPNLFGGSLLRKTGRGSVEGFGIFPTSSNALDGHIFVSHGSYISLCLINYFCLQCN